MDRTENFAVRRGKVLKDIVTNDARLNLVRGNETEELALYHLYTNPNSRQFFDRLPSDDVLAEMLDAYGEKFEANRNAKHGNGSGNAEADKIVNNAKDKAAEIKNESQKFIDEANAHVTEIIDAAKADAAKIIEDAKAEASEIFDAADADAAKIVNDANDKATEIIEDAKADADKIVKAVKAEAKAVKKVTTAKEDPMLE